MKVETSYGNAVQFQQKMLDSHELRKNINASSCLGEMSLCPQPNTDQVQLSDPEKKIVIYALSDKTCPDISDGGIGATDNKGNWYAVTHYEKYNGIEMNEDFLDVLKQASTGSQNINHKQYIDNFVTDALKYLRDFSGNTYLGDEVETLYKQCDELTAEIAANVKAGKENPLSNLQTKFTIGGVNFTYGDLQKSVKTLQYANATLPDVPSTLNYESFAGMGVSVGYVGAFSSQNLNEEQGTLLKERMLQRVNEIIEKRYKSETVSDLNSIHEEENPHRKFYDGTGFVGAANMDYAKSLVNLFANIGKSESNANIQTQFDQALTQFRSCIRPVLVEAGIRGNSIDTLTNYFIDGYKNIFHGSYQRPNDTIESVKEKIRQVNNYLSARA